MRRNKQWVLGLGLAGLLTFTGTAQAALIVQINGTVLDDTTNLIWLENWNVNGLADWDAQMSWADGLEFADSTDWRLPSISEYADLFAEYGNLTSVTQFTNVQSFDFYWSGTEFSSFDAWLFLPGNGLQSVVAKDNALYAVAVRPGDVTAAVPEPGTLGLMLAALGAGAMVRRRRSR